jgi:hypothetical protein
MVTAVILTFAPPLLAPPASTIEAIEAELGTAYRLRDIDLRRKLGQLHLNLELGGTEPPNENLRARLGETLRSELGDEVELRMSFQYESHIP